MDEKENVLGLVKRSKYNSRSLLFALLVFACSTYLINEKKIESDTYGQIVMWTMIMYGGKRFSDNMRGG
jgi:hypothetical protein